MDCQHHLRCPTVSGAPLWDWEMGHETKEELIPTAAAGGDIQGRCTWSSIRIKPPNSQDVEENLDTMREEKHGLTPGTLQPCIQCYVAQKSCLQQWGQCSLMTVGVIWHRNCPLRSYIPHDQHATFEQSTNLFVSKKETEVHPTITLLIKQ